jgi:hypothetical protein
MPLILGHWLSLSPSPDFKAQIVQNRKIWEKWVDWASHPVRTLKIDPIDKAGEAVDKYPVYTCNSPLLKPMSDFFLIN